MERPVRQASVSPLTAFCFCVLRFHESRQMSTAPARVVITAGSCSSLRLPWPLISKIMDEMGTRNSVMTGASPRPSG